MARYVDADKAIEIITEVIHDTVQEDADVVEYEVREAVNSIPTADVREVKHGHWVKVPGFATPGGDPVWGCSECGKGVHVYGIEANTYAAGVADHQWVSCPNCGAIMDEEVE